MDSPDSPKAVDPYVQAAAQFGLNKNTALLGNQLGKTDSYSPTESTTWSSSIDPQDQANYDAQMARYQENMTNWQTARDQHVANPRPALSSPGSSSDRFRSTWVPNSYNGGSWVSQAQQAQQANGLAPVNAPFNLAMPEAPKAPIASKWTSRTQLTPGQQKLFDLRENAQGTLLNQANNNLRQPLDFSGLDKQVGNLGLSNDFSGDRQRVEDALYSRS